MVKRPDRKGRNFESEVADYLRTHGSPHAHQRPRGVAGYDIMGVQGWALECKNRKDGMTAIREGYDQACLDSGLGEEPAVITKRRRNSDVARSWVTIDLETFAKLVADSHYWPEWNDEGEPDIDGAPI